MAETIRPIEAYVDDIDAVLGCMRQDKKINVFFIPLEKYFYVISERWSGWRLFGDGLSNRLPKKGYGDKGLWYTAACRNCDTQARAEAYRNPACKKSSCARKIQN